jgi:hypothetical protein
MHLFEAITQHKDHEFFFTNESSKWKDVRRERTLWKFKET